jgi:hypothetical protein
VLLVFIVYVVQLSQLTTVSAVRVHTLTLPLPRILFQFIVFMFVQLSSVACFQEIVVSIADILSYTAFCDGALSVTQSQLFQYAVSST